MGKLDTEEKMFFSLLVGLFSRILFVQEFCSGLIIQYMNLPFSPKVEEEQKKIAPVFYLFLSIFPSFPFGRYCL